MGEGKYHVSIPQLSKSEMYMNLPLFATEQSGGGRGGMDSHKSDGDAHHFDLGCKLQILVSLMVFGMEGHHIYPFRYHLVITV